MNLSIQQVSKITKLSVPTLYTYASRQKLGKKVGKKRVFSQNDVQKLLKGSKKSVNKKNGKPSARKAKTHKRSIKTVPIKASSTKPNATSSIPSRQAPKSTKPSFWSRLFGGPNEQKRHSLLGKKGTKVKQEIAARIKYAIANR